MNRIKLALATGLAIGSLGLAGLQTVSAFSSPRASEDRLPAQKQSCHMAKKQSCHAETSAVKDCCKDKTAECCKAQKACCKKAAKKSCCDK